MAGICGPGYRFVVGLGVGVKVDVVPAVTPTVAEGVEVAPVDMLPVAEAVEVAPGSAPEDAVAADVVAAFLVAAASGSVLVDCDDGDEGVGVSKVLFSPGAG